MQVMCEQLMHLIEDEQVIGVGTGRTVEACIDVWASQPSFYDKQFVVSSIRTRDYLVKKGYEVCVPNDVGKLHYYFDGVDQIDDIGQALKGQGGAMTQEKLLMHMADICVAVAGDAKKVQYLSNHDMSLPVEVIREARSYAARCVRDKFPESILKWREDFVTDHGNPVIDIKGIELHDTTELELWINSICGVVDSGLCARRPFDQLLLSQQEDVKSIKFR